ncbi:MAG: sigma-70 family RNA polymerase sigma factor [Chloroflexota bacterium]|nr:sigma-70 family RNA polymerase sigma factor [Chloroflexota bacterium]
MDQTDTCTANRTLLRRFIEENAETLMGTLRYYVVRAGLAGRQGATLAAVELLNEVTVEALAHADRFRPSGQPMAWLLGIGANLIKREQAGRATRNRREPLMRDLYPRVQAVISEDELFDRLAALDVSDLAQDLEANEAVSAILALVSEDDRHVLRLALLHDLNGGELAQALNVTHGAARVRLHRALNRLRNAWQAQEQLKGESDEWTRSGTGASTGV